MRSNSSQLSTLNNQRSTSAHHKPVTMHELNAVEAGVSPAILVVAAVYDRRSLPSREASMRDETLFRVTNSRYNANPSSDRVFFRRRCNDLTFPWRAVAHHWGEGGNESRQRS